MAIRVLLNLSNATNKCYSIFSNVQLPQKKFQVQNLFKQTRYFHRYRKTKHTINSPFAKVDVVEDVGVTRVRSLFKGFLFASTFSGATFVGASILEYERIRQETYRRFNQLPFFREFKLNSDTEAILLGWRNQTKLWWNGLTEGQRMFCFIFYANFIVFLAWRVPQLQSVMLKYFTTNPASNANCLPMLLSMFSHYNIWHLAANMYALHSFSTAAVAYLGPEHFFAVYLSSGVISSFVSNAYRILVNRPGYSLGASGAIMGIIAFICTQAPERKLNIIMLPQYTFSAGSAIKSIMAFDALGCVMRWQFIDHAAHLGGAVFGILWQYCGVENIWRKRNHLLIYWHEFRNPPKSH